MTLQLHFTTDVYQSFCQSVVARAPEYAEARWPEDEQKHTGAAVRQLRTVGFDEPHYLSAVRNGPQAIGGPMKRHVLREDEARAGSVYPDSAGSTIVNLNKKATVFCVFF